MKLKFNVQIIIFIRCTTKCAHTIISKIVQDVDTNTSKYKEEHEKSQLSSSRFPSRMSLKNYDVTEQYISNSLVRKVFVLSLIHI